MANCILGELLSVTPPGVDVFVSFLYVFVRQRGKEKRRTL